MSFSRAIRSLPETVTPGERSTTARRCMAIHGRGNRPRATNTAPKTLRAGQTQPGTGEKPRRADLRVPVAHSGFPHPHPLYQTWAGGIPSLAVTLSCACGQLPGSPWSRRSLDALPRGTEKGRKGKASGLRADLLAPNPRHCSAISCPLNLA